MQPRKEELTHFLWLLCKHNQTKLNSETLQDYILTIKTLYIITPDGLPHFLQPRREQLEHFFMEKNNQNSFEDEIILYLFTVFLSDYILAIVTL